MTALYIAGYALGAVLTWVLWLRILAAKWNNPNYRWTHGNTFGLAIVGLAWPIAVGVFLPLKAVHWGTERLFNYFKRRG